MRIVRFASQHGPAYGALEGDEVRTLPDGLEGDLQPGPVAGSVHELELLAPCDPRIIVCAGSNYAGQLAEKGRELPTQPPFFLKAVNTVTGPGTAIAYPDELQRLEYEGELAVVIGRTARDVPVESFADFVLGYTCANDVTADDWRSDGQWVRAKSVDTFCPLGPSIQTEVFDPGSLHIRTRLNDETVQDSPTSDMVFGVPELLSFITRWVTLGPGDVVLTGSPANVGALQVGDVVEVEISGVGRLTNTVEHR